MQGSLEQFLEDVAHRGSWVGGGSVAALSAALAAALLEKLVVRVPLARALRSRRRRCLGFMERDARTFARVIQASRAQDHQAFQRALKMATEVPYQVYQHATAIHGACKAAQRSIKPQFQSDLSCAIALADAARVGAKALIDTNLAWLKDRGYATTLRRRLRLARKRHVH